MRRCSRIKKSSTGCLTIFWVRISSRIVCLKVAGPRPSTSKTRTATSWTHDLSYLAITGVRLSRTNQSCRLKVAARCSNRTFRIATWLHPKTTAWIYRLTFTNSRLRQQRANATPPRFPSRTKNVSRIRKKPTAASKTWHPFSELTAPSKDSVPTLTRGWAPGSKPPRTWLISCLRIRLPKCRKNSQIRLWNNRVRISKIRNSRSRSFRSRTSNRLIRTWTSTKNFR